MPKNAEFFKFQELFNKNINKCTSHQVINMYIDKYAQDYRYQEAPHPIKDMQDRTIDNTSIGRLQK